jgi:hypothetical protein
MNSNLPAVSQKQNSSLPAERPVKRNIVRMIGEVDRPLMLIIIALICVGLVMVFSSSYAHADTRYGDSYRLIKSQLRAALIGLATMLAVTRLDYRIIKKFGVIACFVIYGLNYAVPFIGTVFSGAKRWIQFGGFTMQPSELLKFAVILAAAIYISDNYHKISSATTFRKQMRTLLPMALIAVAAAGASNGMRKRSVLEQCPIVQNNDHTSPSTGQLGTCFPKQCTERVPRRVVEHLDCHRDIA